MFWASSYNLFVTWSVNGQHPWDLLPAANKPAATLEIGSLRGSKDKVCFPLEGKSSHWGWVAAKGIHLLAAA